MTVLATDTHHGHPAWSPQPQPPQTATDRRQVQATDTATDTTDSQDHGHDWGGYIPPVGPVRRPGSHSQGSEEGYTNSAHPVTRSRRIDLPGPVEMERAPKKSRYVALA
jgi:hypothetical protein